MRRTRADIVGAFTTLTHPVARLGAALGVLAALLAGLPIRFQHAADGPSSEECLLLADQPPSLTPDALPQLERCSGLVPEDVELLADLGMAYEATGRPADAERVYVSVLSKDSQYADVRARLAALLLRRGAASQAREHALQALRVQPNRKSLHQLLDDINRSATP